MALCVEDVDCAPTQTNRLCYSNLTGAFDVDSQGCACNTFYGWTGSSCTDLSESSYVTIWLLSITSALSLIQVLALAVVLRKTLKKRGCVYSEKMFTTIFILLGAFGACGWSLVVVLSTVFNTGPGIIAEPDTYSDPFSGRFNAFALLFGPLAIGATVLGLLNVTILLIDVADRARAFTVGKSKFLVRNRVLIHAFQCLCILLAVVAFAYEKGFPEGTSILGFVLGPPAIIVIFGYAFGSYKINKVLSSANLADKYTPIITGVRNTAGGVFVSMILYVISVVIYSTFDTFGGSWKNFSSSDGSFGAAKAFHHLQIVSVMLACGAVTKFLYDSSFHSKKRTSIATLANRFSLRTNRLSVNNNRPSSVRTRPSSLRTAERETISAPKV